MSLKLPKSCRLCSDKPLVDARGAKFCSLSIVSQNLQCQLRQISLTYNNPKWTTSILAQIKRQEEVRKLKI